MIAFGGSSIADSSVSTLRGLDSAQLSPIPQANFNSLNSSLESIIESHIEIDDAQDRQRTDPSVLDDEDKRLLR